jgi:hypothetical protein
VIAGRPLTLKILGDTQMKTIKLLVLVLSLAIGGYTYASAQSDHTGHAKADKAAACCATGSACAKEDGGCCAAGAECCKAGGECCKAGAECCKAGAECCASHGDCCKEGKCAMKSENTTAKKGKSDKAGCCGSSCAMAKTAKK